MIALPTTAPGPKSSRQPLVLDEMGAVLLAYGRSNKHVPLLDSLLAAGLPPRNIVVVHNPDRPPDGWKPIHPSEGALLAQDRNVGYSAAMNAGIRRLRGLACRVALLLTHDARLESDTLAQLLNAANSAPDFGVLGPAIVGAGGASISYGSYIRRNGIVRHITQAPANVLVADVPFVDGSAVFLRLAACGNDPLPERYFMYFEEGELCASMRQRGWRVGVATQAKASSVSGIRNRTVAFTYLYTRNGLDWTLHHRGWRAALRFALEELGRAWDDAPKPGGGAFRQPALRRSGWRQVTARLLGMADFSRGQWGPPPSNLLRMSDVRNT
jgi:GT2 family glycosyltransferase